MRNWAAALSILIQLGCSTLCAADPACPLAGQKPMQVAQLFFGLDIRGRGPVTPREWRRFAVGVLTPNFPDGFTVYEAEGQWRDARTGSIVRERSKVVLVAGTADADFSREISTVADAYKRQFRQRSVGILTEPACGAF